MGLIYKKHIRKFQTGNIIPGDNGFYSAEDVARIQSINGIPQQQKRDIYFTKDKANQIEREKREAYAREMRTKATPAGARLLQALSDPYSFGKMDDAERAQYNAIASSKLPIKEKISRQFNAGMKKVPSAALNTGLALAFTPQSAFTKPGIHTAAAVGNQMFNPLAGTGIGRKILSTKVGKYMQKKALKDIENKGIKDIIEKPLVKRAYNINPSGEIERKVTVVNSPHNIYHIDNGTGVPSLPNSFLRRNDARIMANRVLRNPEKINLIRVDKPVGLYAKEGNVYINRAPYIHKEDNLRVSRNTTHFARNMVKDVFGSSWDDTTVAFIDNLDNLKNSSRGHVLDVDPTDTFIYTPKDFKVGKSTTIITRDNKFYRNAKKEGIKNVHYIGNSTTDNQWRKFLNDIMNKNKSTDYHFAKQNRFIPENTMARAKKGEKIFDSSSKSHANSPLVWGETLSREKDIDIAISELKNNYYDFLPPEVISNEYKKILDSPVFKSLPIEKKEAYIKKMGI